ncbi:MAG: adenine-specific methyltransferase EcoRI family protein, partial [Deferribacteraceae bacterium]|nr:adenine-specific methyltransferase EcoRI family protein [Deferribacteraceae bacterium]
PFSLFREYVEQIVTHNKLFLIIGDLNAISYKEIFKYIKENVIWLGIDNGGTKWFEVPGHYEILTQSRIKIENGIKYFSKGSIMWFTNLDHKKRHEDIILYKTYNPIEYPKYGCNKTSKTYNK